MKPLGRAIRMFASRLTGGRARGAGLLRAIAGSPAAVVPQRAHRAAGRTTGRANRRGTVLIIVLGTLALISVITVVYVVVGRADRRGAAAFVGSVQREEMPVLVRDYIVGIVGRDALATYRDGAGDLKREAFDYPFTDPYVRSILPGQTGVSGATATPTNERIARRFNAVGTYDSVSLYGGSPAGVAARGSLGNVYELRVPSDPWLAATVPSNIRIDDDLSDGTFPQWENRDWAHISNVSPDGRFVNLWNLRNNFNAASGFNEANREISSRLTLYGPGGMPFTATGNQTLDNGQTAQANAPAHWTNRQRNAFRPVSGIPTIDWSQAEHPSYQWVDADGDGFYDSRLFEFVDLSQGVDMGVPVLAIDDGHRWFAGVRIVDLSASVNVNTATDFLADPSTMFGQKVLGPGASPADIDLRRLLSGEDLYEMTGFVGYLGLRPPTTPVGAVNPASAQYTGPTGSAVAGLGASGQRYAEYSGDAAYNAARVFLDFGVVARDTVRLAPFDNYQSFAQFLQSELFFPAAPNQLLRFGSENDRAAYYDAIVGLDDMGMPGTELSVFTFGLDSEAELRTFRAANDPSVRSVLEIVLDGRFDNEQASLTETSLRYGPLRSNRGAQVELAARDRANENMGGASFNPGTLPSASADGFGDYDATTQSLADIRQYLTTASNARPLRNTFIAPRNSAPSTIPALNSGDVLSQVSSGASTIFRLYGDALLPYSSIVETWDRTSASNSFLTLSYGHAGSELALRHAAHMAVNMADASDADANPTVATVIADAAVRGDLDADYDPPYTGTGTIPTSVQLVTNRQHPWAAWVNGGSSRFDLGDTRIGDSDTPNAAPVNPAYNVYGVEPQPFVTEVSAIIMYTDAPVSAGGDMEPPGQDITIDGTISGSNPDLAFQAMVFQITNPFDAAIDLSGDTMNFESKFYLEFGGRYYRFANTDPAAIAMGWTGSLAAGQTRTFYITAHPIDDIRARWNAYAGGTGDPAQFNAWFNSVMGVTGGTGGPPVMLEEFDPDTGAAVAFGPGAFADRFAATSAANATTAQVRLWRTVIAPGRNQSNQPVESYQANTKDNDVLADRFREPPTASGDPETFVPKLPDGNMQIAGATVPSTGFSEPQEDFNRGVTVLLWGTVRRPSDPEVVAVGNPLEVEWLPAYCIEPQHTMTLNTAQRDAVDRNGLDVSDVRSGIQEITQEFGTMIFNAYPVVTSLVVAPHNRTGDDIGFNLQGQSWTDVRGEFYNDMGGQNARDLRPGDLLVPLGIGASLVVDASMQPNPDLSGWTTLGEAMAMALDYDEAPAGNVLVRPSRPDNLSVFNRRSLDRGHLISDQFVAFEDLNANGVFDAGTDIVYGDGQPTALGVLANLRGLGDEYGNVRRGVRGLININTAPLAVLRTLPMLSPTHGGDPSVLGSWMPGAAWAGSGLRDSGQDVNSDAASMLVAFRDLQYAFARLAPSAGAPLPVDEINMTAEYWFPTPSREGFTGITGLRQTPGFRSIAEVLNARDNSTRMADPPVSAPHDLDRLGFDQQPMNALGLDPVFRPAGMNGTDRLVDEVDERYAIYNSIANCITVRSDTYVAWFVLHGYREQDCIGLGPDDPLLPSVARRFMMVIDRSNVVAPGDKPRVLIFREVPYSPLGVAAGAS
ncbi:MAG: hypothetical protein KDA05_09195 [Phycisphaerales bacterium]|nr:hypothetical protein [Phycisphaerales bacterium]